MIRVLLAEDETAIRRGITTLIETVNPLFRVVAAVKNGREAIDYLDKNKVDVVITDINMPIVSGVELMSYLHQNHPDVFVVVISGYDDFNYARSAIQYGAEDYLLKPPEKRELQAALQKLSDKIVARRYQQRHQAFSDAMFSPQKGKEESLISPTFLLYLCAGPLPAAFHEDFSPGKQFWDEVNLQSLVQSLISREDFAWVYSARSLAEYAVILSLKDKNDIRPVADTLQKKLSGGMPVSIAVSGCIRQLGDVQEEYIRLRQLLFEESPFLKSGVVYEWESGKSSGAELLDEDCKERIRLAVKSERFGEFQREADALFQRIRQTGCSQREVKRTLSEVCLMVYDGHRWFESYTVEDTVSELISSAESVSGLREDFLEVCRDVMKKDYFDTKDKGALMASVEQYILKNLASSISTKALSQKFGLVAPYLSRLFKDYKGVTPAQYIQNIRLQAAKKLLIEKPDMLSKEIAEYLGYNNATYFSRAFKKNFGVYPSEYRKEKTGETVKNQEDI